VVSLKIVRLRIFAQRKSFFAFLALNYHITKETKTKKENKNKKEKLFVS